MAAAGAGRWREGGKGRAGTSHDRPGPLPPGRALAQTAALLLVLLVARQPGEAQATCKIGFRHCIASGKARCIPRGTCCTGGDCPLANDFCPGPGSMCRCHAGFKRCIRSGVARCIRQGTCCTNADCPLANDMCPGPGGRCRCAAGFKVCATPAGRRCIPTASCCTSADCQGGNLCPAPGQRCGCPAGRKLCETKVNGLPFRGCILSTACCTNADCRQLNSRCTLPGSVCSQPSAVVWGRAYGGQLGSQERLDSYVPTRVFRLDRHIPARLAGLPYKQTVLSVSAGQDHTCAATVFEIVDPDNRETVHQTLCWGRNDQNQLGAGEDAGGADSAIPLPVFNIGVKFTHITAGWKHTCAIGDYPGQAHAAFCWGWGGTYQLGYGGNEDVATPVAVAGGHAFHTLSAGRTHTCGVTLKSVGLCWGSGYEGELGSRVLTGKVPTLVVDSVNRTVSGWRSLSAGTGFTCGVKVDSTAHCFGWGAAGTLGSGVTGEPYTGPVLVAGGRLRFTQVTSGEYHACGILSTNFSSVCWGAGWSGQLGQGTNSSARAPVLVAGSHRFSAALKGAISAGSHYTCALLSTGAASCWGADVSADGYTRYYGELGNGFRPRGAPFSRAPEPVSWPGRLSRITAGGNHACAVEQSVNGAKIVCWGKGEHGQLAAHYQRLLPRYVPEPVGVSGQLLFKSVTAGLEHSCGILVQEYAVCWGSNTLGALGSGATPSAVTYAVRMVEPRDVAVWDRPRWKQLSAGWYHTCGITSNGTLYCWGACISGQCGRGRQGQTTLPSAGAVPPPHPRGKQLFSKVAAGGAHTCAIVLGSSVLLCWGDNSFGQLGFPLVFAGSYFPMQLPDLRFSDVAAGKEHTAGILVNGSLVCWGRGSAGQLGADSFPPYVAAPTRVAGNGLYSGVTAGREHTCALNYDGRGDAYCFGRGAEGQLGLGHRNNVAVPTVVKGGFTFLQISAGNEHTCGVTADRQEAVCWGTNTEGQLGIGVPCNPANPSSCGSTVPMRVPGQFKQVAAGGRHTVGVTTSSQLSL